MSEVIINGIHYCHLGRAVLAEHEIMRLRRENAELERHLQHAKSIVKDLENKMAPANEYLAQLEEAADLAVRGFRRWKRNQNRGGDRNEADHGLTDLGQGVSDLDALLLAARATPQTEAE